MAKKCELQLSVLRDIDNHLRATKRTSSMLSQLSQQGFVRTAYYIGNGRYKRAVDNTNDVISQLRKLGISHAEGNDAPKGGIIGKFVILTSDALMNLIGKNAEWHRLRKLTSFEWKYVNKKKYSHEELLEQARKKIEWVNDDYKDDEEKRYWLNVYHGCGVYELIISHGRIVGSIADGFHCTIPNAEKRIPPQRSEWIEVLSEVISEKLGNDWFFIKADGSGSSFFLRYPATDAELNRYVKVYDVPDVQHGGMHTNYEITGEEQKVRYVLQASEQHPDGFVCTDTENGIVCRFERHKFNETSKMTFLEDVSAPDAQSIARLMREMGDWLGKNHYDKLF